MAPPETIVLIICGPAGSGKTTLCERLLAEFPDRLQRVVTSTSRAPRPGEIDGVDYHFLAADVFERKIQSGEFVEWARVHGRYYGSQTAHLLAGLASGRDLLLNIDVQGARAFRAKEREIPGLAGRIRTVFIRPASLEQIRERMRGRGAEDPAEIELRLRTARAEIAAASEFDHVIVSGTREADYAALRAYYLALKNGSAPA